MLVGLEVKHTDGHYLCMCSLHAVLLIFCRLQTSACLSPCGGMVIAGSEDGTVHMWNADTGEQLAIYSGLQFHGPASGVDYHPFEHMAAFASYGNNAYIVICDHDKLDSGKNIGLQMLVQQDAAFQSTTGDITDSCMKSSTPFHSRLLSLQEKKKLMPVYVSEVEVLQGSPLPATDTTGFSLSPNSANVTSPWKENDEASREKLASIIEKMDQVLSRTPKRSQHSSGSFSRSLDPKLSDISPSKTESLGHSSHRKKKREPVLSVK
jgi:WD40 repeat protein